MRKLEKQMNFALSNKSNWAGSNTTVRYNDNTNCSSVYLHGILDEVDYGCKVFQKNWDWYFSNNNQTVDFWDGMILCGGEIL